MTGETASPHDGTNYFAIFGVLMVLTLLTVAFSRMHFGHLGAFMVAMAVALTKGTLVAMYFMHLKIETRHLVAVVVIPALLFMLTFVLGIFPDIAHLGGAR